MELFLNEFESFVGVNFWTMIFAWCNLIILYLFLRKILFKPVKNMIDSRQEEIDSMYKNAEDSEKSAAILKAEYEKKIELAEDECADLLKAAQRKAQLREEEILREANEKAARTLERADEEIELEKRKIINEAKDRVSDMAVEIAAAIIERDVSGEEHKSLIDSFIDGIGDTND